MQQAEQHSNASPATGGFVNYFQVMDPNSGYALTRELPLQFLAERAMKRLKGLFPACKVISAGWRFDESDPLRGEFVEFLLSDAPAISQGEILATHPQLEAIREAIAAMEPRHE